MRPQASDVCRGRWIGILRELGVHPKFLTGRHGPCPFCGGVDRYRFDDKDGRGTFFCSQCGAGDGFTFLKRLNGWDFKTAWEMVGPIAGMVPRSVTRQQRDDNKLLRLSENLWNSGEPLVIGKRIDTVQMYLRKRGIRVIPSDVAYVEKCKLSGGDQPVWLPAMVAKVTGPDGSMVSVHRTYLTIDGDKANVPEPKKMMPGPIPRSSAVRLATSGYRLGIAEGIETALSAMQLFGMPVWSALNAAQMMTFTPPDEVGELYIFGDHDPKFAGQSAAYALAHRLAVTKTAPRKIVVRIPDEPGDWNDVLRRNINKE